MSNNIPYEPIILECNRLSPFYTSRIDPLSKYEIFNKNKNASWECLGEWRRFRPPNVWFIQPESYASNI